MTNGLENGRSESGRPEKLCVKITRAVWRRLQTVQPITLFTFILVVFTGVQVWAFMESERAFVFPMEANFAGPPIDGKQPFDFYLTLQNTGKSVAVIEDMVAYISHELPPLPLAFPGGVKFGAPPLSQTVKVRAHVHFPSGPLMAETTTEIRTGKKKFYFFGKVLYGDDFSALLGSRSSQFCFIYARNVADPEKNTFVSCPEPGHLKAE